MAGSKEYRAPQEGKLPKPAPPPQCHKCSQDAIWRLVFRYPGKASVEWLACSLHKRTAEGYIQRVTRTSTLENSVLTCFRLKSENG
jgi:hypothetical protein